MTAQANEGGQITSLRAESGNNQYSMSVRWQNRQQKEDNLNH